MPRPWAFIDGFVNPALLAGLALAAAPIIIHLLYKRRFRVVDWAAMDFLLQADATNRRRLRLEDLILLLLRVALIVFIVGALARPVLRGYVGVGEDEKHIIIDDSLSMDAAHSDGLPIVRAQNIAARRIQQEIEQHRPFTVWAGSRAEQLRAVAATAGSGHPESAVAEDPQFVASGAAALRHVRALDATDGSLRVDRLIGRLRERFNEVEQSLLRGVYLIHDLRASDWLLSGATRDLRPEILAAVQGLKADGLSERTTWHLINVGRAGRENLAVAAIDAAASRPLVGRRTTLQVVIRNTGLEVRRGVVGRIEIGDPRGGPVSDAVATGATPERFVVGGTPFRSLQSLPLPLVSAIEPNGSVRVQVECVFASAGEHPVIVQLENTGDALTRDDVFYGTVFVDDAIRVTIIDGDPGADRLGSESGFLAAALSPRGGATTGVVTTTNTGAFSSADLDDAHVVMVLNRGEFAAAEVDALKSFCRRGGGAAFFVGDKVDPRRYETAFASFAVPEGARNEAGVAVPGADARTWTLFPVRLGARRDGIQHLRRTNEEHKAFQIFSGVESSSLDRVVFSRYFDCEPAPHATVVATFDDPEATPAVIEASVPALTVRETDATGTRPDTLDRDGVGAEIADDEDGSPGIADQNRGGKVVFFNFTADRDWGDWPTDPTFPVIMHEWVSYLAGAPSERRTVSCGSPLVWRTSPGFEYEVATPSGRVQVLEPSRQRRSYAEHLSYAETFTAGFYRVWPRRQGAGDADAGSDVGPLWYAVVPARNESELEPADESHLLRQLRDAGLDVTSSGGGEVESGSRRTGGEIWSVLAFFAAALLVVELLFAAWLGRR